MATFIESIDSGKRLLVEHTRGEPLSITLEFVDATAITVVTDRDWSGEVRSTVDSETVVADFVKASEATETLAGGVSARVIVLTSDDAADLEAGDYVFDLQRDTGPSSPKTYATASKLTIVADVTRDGGS